MNVFGWDIWEWLAAAGVMWILWGDYKSRKEIEDDQQKRIAKAHAENIARMERVQERARKAEAELHKREVAENAAKREKEEELWARIIATNKQTR